MADRERRDDPKAPKASPATPNEGRGGFGEFAEQYRARWAANHPNMRRREREADVPEPGPPQQAPAESAPPAEGPANAGVVRPLEGTKLFVPPTFRKLP